MFKWIQTFYLDSAVVQGSQEASISKIGLYCRGKPKAIDNKSGIEKPGVEVSIVPVIGGIPAIAEMQTIRPPEPTEHGARFSPRFEIARKEWGEIIATTDATVETEFIFKNPIQVKTKTEYGILIKCDGNEDYVFWTSVQGSQLVDDKSKLSPGVSNKYVGSLFSFIGTPNLNVNNLTPANTNANTSATITTQTNLLIPTYTPDIGYTQTNWKPVPATDLKFKVYVSRFYHNGYAVAANSTVLNDPKYTTRTTLSKSTITQISDDVIRISSPVLAEEFVLYDISKSSISGLRNSDKVFQPQPYYPGGRPTSLTVTVGEANNKIQANSSYLHANGSTFGASNGFYNIFNPVSNTDQYIVVDGGSYVNVRKVVSIVNNTQIIVDRPINFTNTAAKFYKAPVGEIAGVSTTYTSGFITNFLILTNSNANDSLRFVNNTILTATVNVGGSGYSNNDYLTITGFESSTNIIGGYAARANLVTNSSGGLVSVNFSNSGCGFVNTAMIAGSNIVISNSSNLPSTGTGATFSFTVGANLKTENTTVLFSNCIVTNIEASRIKPEITVNNPLGTAFVVNHRSLFYSKANTATASGKDYFIYNDPSITDIPVKIFKSHDAGREEAFTSCVPSRSNQFVIPYANGSPANTSVIGSKYSNAAVFMFDISSNNDFTSTFIEPEIINSHYSKYVINNDYTGENTNYGNAYAKHVSTKTAFNKDRSAEDILVYLTAYRPAGTDFKVFARIHNNKDSDAFDDHDWTLLEEIDGNDVYSSVSDTSDFIELTYNFTDSPNTTPLTGTVTVANVTTTTITGSGTLFNTELTSNDIVKISQPLFSSNSFAICSINSITNSSSLTLNTPISNTGLLGTGLVIEKVAYTKQAFNNKLNSNIVKYYNSDQVELDGYDSFQMKIVMLSNNDSIVPKIDDVRVIGVTT